MLAGRGTATHGRMGQKGYVSKTVEIVRRAFSEHCSVLPHEAGKPRGIGGMGWDRVAQPSTLMHLVYASGSVLMPIVPGTAWAPSRHRGRAVRVLIRFVGSLHWDVHGGGGPHGSPLRRVKAGEAEQALTRFFKTVGDGTALETPFVQEGVTACRRRATGMDDVSLTRTQFVMHGLGRGGSRLRCLSTVQRDLGRSSPRRVMSTALPMRRGTFCPSRRPPVAASTEIVVAFFYSRDLRRRHPVFSARSPLIRQAAAAPCLPVPFPLRQARLHRVLTDSSLEPCPQRPLHPPRAGACQIRCCDERLSLLRQALIGSVRPGAPLAAAAFSIQQPDTGHTHPRRRPWRRYLPLAATVATALHGILRPVVLHLPRKGSQIFVEHPFHRVVEARTETVLNRTATLFTRQQGQPAGSRSFSHGVISFLQIMFQPDLASSTPPVGFEPTTDCLEGSCSVRLS